jgi:hypothetical protein
MLYYISVCLGSITAKGDTWTCMNSSWYWAVNDPSIDSNVQAKYIFPSGQQTSFGNPKASITQKPSDRNVRADLANYEQITGKAKTIKNPTPAFWFTHQPNLGSRGS